MKSNKQLLTCVSLVTALILAGCDSNNNPSIEIPVPPPPVVTTTDFSYEVTVTNLTSSQPLSPITVVCCIFFKASLAFLTLLSGGTIFATSRPLEVSAITSPFSTFFKKLTKFALNSLTATFSILSPSVTYK